MYKQRPGISESSDSIRRFSSNNPFRSYVKPNHANHSTGSVRSSNSAFEEWVDRNRKLIESDEDSITGDDILGFYGNSSASPEKSVFNKPPQIPAKPVRTGSDSNVTYSSERKMSSNNPFASAMSGEYVHYRDPPAPPQPSQRSRTNTPPSRPPKQNIAPPSYEEAAGTERSKSDYPREKSSSVSGSSGRHHHQQLQPPSVPREDRVRRSRSESDKRGASHHRSHRSSKKDGDRERKHKKSPSKKNPQPVKSKNLDTIDKLDVTAFFGGGFHHDGPFDACTPHRNKNVKAAPVEAFPVDGPNSSISGFNTKSDKHKHVDVAFGRYDEEQNEIVGKRTPYKNPTINTNDPSTSMFIPKQNPSIVNFDTNQKAVPVHGDMTPGLGTSTFLDGAPAPRGIQNDDLLQPPSLGRKKSLVQRLRKNSGSEPRRASNENEPTFYTNDEPESNSLLRRVKSLKVGRK